MPSPHISRILLKQGPQPRLPPLLYPQDNLLGHQLQPLQAVQGPMQFQYFEDGSVSEPPRGQLLPRLRLRLLRDEARAARVSRHVLPSQLRRARHMCLRLVGRRRRRGVS